VKRIIVSACLLLTFVCVLPSLGQAQQRNVSRRVRRKQAAANKPPVIKSFTSQSGTVTIPCPYWNSWNSIPCTPSPIYKVRLTTDAADPNDDALNYEYSVTGGRIIGEGSSAEWNYEGLKPGSYTAKVVVKNQHGGVTSSTVTVSVIRCPMCDPSCPTLTILCPDDADEGQPLTLSINVSGAEPGRALTYKWSISAGTIMTGQGTPTIVVDTTGLAGKKVTATVDVGNIDPSCQRTISCEVQIRKKDGGEKR
jgi:hypothetical protein